MRAEEYEHVVIKSLVGGEVVAYGAVHHRAGVFDACGVEDVGGVAVVHVADDEEVVLVLVLDQQGEEVVKLAGGRVEDFALAVYDVLLQVEGDGLGGAEVLHRVGDRDAHLFAKVEEMVDGSLGGENDGCEVGYVDFLLAEFACVKAFDLDEGPKYYFHSVLLLDVEVWRLV